jgi:hypothetical protein
MALLTFPANPVNGQLYPVNPPPGTNVYQWSSTEQTWSLISFATGVIPGTYGNSLEVAQFTVTNTGKLTFSQNIPIQIGDTTQIGLVQLNDTVTSSSSTIAGTARTVKLAYDAAKASTQTVTANPPLKVNLTNPQFPVVSVDSTVGVSGGISSLGVTSIADNTATNSASIALSAKQGLSLQSQIDALVVSPNLTLGGRLDGTGTLTFVTTEGAAIGFVLNDPLPNPATSNVNYFAICTEEGTFIPTGETTPVTVTQGDWLLSTGTNWVYLDVGVKLVPILAYLDDISGSFNGVQTDFPLTLSGVPTSPGPNLLIFVGGVPQVPNVAFSVTSSTISFTEPPAAGSSFIGVTATKA